MGLGQELVAGGWWVCLKYLKRGLNRKEERGNKDFKNGGAETMSMGGCLKGAGTPIPTIIPAVFTLYFKFLRCLKIY